MKKRFLFVVAFSLLPVFAPAAGAGAPPGSGDPGTVFARAGKAYGESRYDEAIADYESLLAGGWESGNVYYNLGNCYFKKGGLGKAVLNYERARRLMPRDGDLKANYDYAVSRIRERPPEPRRIWLLRLPEKISGRFTVDELTIFLSVVFVLALAVLASGLFLPAVRRRWPVLMLVLALAGAAAGSALSGRIILLEREAVIVAGNVEAKFEPRLDATTYFGLSEGMKVVVLETEGEWCKIRRIDGRIAWMERKNLELI